MIASLAFGPLAIPQQKRADEGNDNFARWLAKDVGPPAHDQLGGANPPAGTPVSLPNQARVFNEDGLLTAGVSDPPVEIATDTQITQRALEANQTIEPGEQPVASTQMPMPSIAGRRISRTNDLPSLNLVHVREPHGRSTDIVHATSAEPPPVDCASEPLETGEVAHAPAAERRQFGDRARATLNIALNDIERGLQVLVAVQALDVEERARLVNEIAALLSRHGLVAREVRIVSPHHFNQREGQ